MNCLNELISLTSQLVARKAICHSYSYSYSNVTLNPDYANVTLSNSK
jgi:hypothetical protein